MKKLLLLFFLFFSGELFAQTNIAVPNYASTTNSFNASTGNIKFYLNGVSQTHTVGRGVNGVVFYGNDMFVAYDDNINSNKGILWYANVSFSSGTFSASSPVNLLTGQGTFSVAVDASGNVYCANNNGTVTKFNRGATAPRYSSADKITTAFWTNGGFAEASGVFVDNSTSTLWAVSYANNQGAVVKLSDFAYVDGFGNNTRIKRFADGNVPNSFIQKPEGIAKDAAGNIWIANNNNHYVLRLNNASVTSFLNALNANDYDFVTFAPSVFNDFAVTTPGHQLGGLVYDNLYSQQMYVNDQQSGANTFIYSFYANNSAPSFTATSMTQIYPGAGQAAVIPCALLPTPNNPTSASANPSTINSGGTSILIASGCAADQTYRWKEGTTVLSNSINYDTPPLSASKTYTVYCVRGGTCESSGTNVTVTVNAASFNVSANPTTICVGSSSVLTASGCTGNVLWNNGQTTTSILVSPSTTTNFSATCSTGGSGNVTVTVNPNPPVTISSSVPTTVSDCGFQDIVYIRTGQTTTLSGSGCSGTIAWTNFSSTVNGNPVVITAPALNLLENGMKIMTAYCTHANGCINYSSSISILNQFATDDNFSTNVNTPVTGNVITNDTETTVAWGAYGPTSTPNGTISWQMGMPRPTGVFTYTPNPGFQGTDTFTYYVSDDLTCSKRATVTITVGSPCSNNIVITTATYPSYTANQVVKALQTITTQSPPNIQIIPTNSNNLTYQAGNSIILNPGFSVSNGAVFNAKIAPCSGNQTFYIEGKNLKDPCGNTVILRGLNKMHLWTDQNGVSIPEMALTGANSVRIVWQRTWDHDGDSYLPNGNPNPNATPKIPTDDVKFDNLIALCIANKMIPIVEMHDATCDWSQLQFVVDYWKRPEILTIINKYKHALILNIGNEIGDYNVSSVQFQSGYIDAVSQLRNAGITVPIMIDASDCGKNIDILLQTGQNIINNDPLHSIILSAHAYWPMNDVPVPNPNPNNIPPNSGYGTQAFITSKLEAAANANLPLIIGELANYGAWNWNYDICQQYGQVNYQWIASECHRLGLGYLAWDWGPGNTGAGNPNCNVMDMTTAATYATLWGWGANIVGKTIANPNLNNATYTIKNAQKTPYILSGFQTCN